MPGRGQNRPQAAREPQAVGTLLSDLQAKGGHLEVPRLKSLTPEGPTVALAARSPLFPSGASGDGCERNNERIFLSFCYLSSIPGHQLLGSSVSETYVHLIYSFFTISVKDQEIPTVTSFPIPQRKPLDPGSETPNVPQMERCGLWLSTPDTVCSFILNS